MAGKPFIYDESLARHYDEDYAMLRRDAGDVRFYRELALASAGATLDLGCGTGRVLLSLARAGVDVTGVDPSPAMLERLARRLADEPPAVRERVTLADGHLEEPGVEGPFGLVMSAFRVFQHLETDSARLAALAAMARVLGPGGRLAFDVFDFDPRRAAASIDGHVDYLLDADGRRRERHSSSRLDLARGMLLGEFRWLEQGRVIDRASFRLAVLGRDQLLDLLDRAGLELIGLQRDFEGAPWRPDDPGELVVLARPRPEGGSGPVSSRAAG